MWTVREALTWVDGLAPFDTQADFDNSGLLLGNPEMAVRGIHVALDISSRVLDEAEKAGANLLLTHHPLMFRPVQRLTEDTSEARLICRIIRGGQALIAAHTNWDAAPGGINDTLAKVCGLTQVEGEGFWRVGCLAEPLPLDALADTLSRALHATIRVMGQWPAERLARRVCVSGGAGSECWEEALAHGADIFLTGEMKHHHALAAAEHGMAVLEAGHFATEEPGILALADALATFLAARGEPIKVSKSQAGAYALPVGTGGGR